MCGLERAVKWRPFAGRVVLAAKWWRRLWRSPQAYAALFRLYSRDGGARPRGGLGKACSGSSAVNSDWARASSCCAFSSALRV